MLTVPTPIVSVTCMPNPASPELRLLDMGAQQRRPLCILCMLSFGIQGFRDWLSGFRAFIRFRVCIINKGAILVFKALGS